MTHMAVYLMVMDTPLRQGRDVGSKLFTICHWVEYSSMSTELRVYFTAWRVGVNC